MIVVDSSIWIAAFRQGPSEHRDRLGELLDRQRVVLGDLVLAEVLQGFRDDARYAKAKQLLSRCKLEEMAGEEAALEAAAAYRMLRRRGVAPRSTIDVFIACHCVRHGHRLMHADRDFDLMAEPLGLAVA